MDGDNHLPIWPINHTMPLAAPRVSDRVALLSIGSLLAESDNDGVDAIRRERQRVKSIGRRHVLFCVPAKQPPLGQA